MSISDYYNRTSGTKDALVLGSSRILLPLLNHIKDQFFQFFIMANRRKNDIMKLYVYIYTYQRNIGSICMIL